MKIDPRHLIAFSEIVDRSSFTLAAKALGTTQPALSRLLSDLEQRLGAQLLAQRKSPMIPTDLGRALAEKGLALKGIVSEAETTVAGFERGEEGLLRLGAPPFFAEDIVPQILLGFRKKRPKVIFEFHSAYLPELLKAVETRDIDLALGPIGVEQARANFDVHAFTRLDHAIVCRTGHPILRLKHIAVQELAEAEWVSQTSESMLYRIMTDGLSSLGVQKINTVIQSDSGAALMQVVKQSDCLTVLPTFSALPGLRAGTLAIVPSSKLPSLSFGASLHSSVPATSLVTALLEHMAMVFDTQAEEYACYEV